jgi:CubicO group peptidase (beta-lactamase class C family)
MFLAGMSPALGQSPSPAVSASPSLQAELDARTAASPGSGLIVATIDPGGVTLTTSGSGGTSRPLDRHSLFEIGSVTKTFTATILATMVLDGSVKLDDPVAKYLPPGVHVPSRNGKAITLLDLATQHSGLPRLPDNLDPADAKDPYAHYTVAKMYAFLSHYKLTRDPGAKFEYSNFAVALLGQALANREHTSYAELLQRRVLGPLHMNDTTLSLTPAQTPRFTVGRSIDDTVVPPWTFDAIAPAGALHSSIDDLVKYARGNMGQGPLAAACLFAQRPRADFPGHHIGLVWWTDDSNRVVHHGGDTFGYHASIAIAPDRTSAVVVLADGGLPVEDIALHTYDPSILLASVPSSKALDPAVLESYLGTYVNSDQGLTFVVARDGAYLSLQLTGQSALRVYNVDPDTFVYHAVSARVKFSRDDAGKPVALTLAQNGQTIVFLRPGTTAVPAAALSAFPTPMPVDAATLQGYVGSYTSPAGVFSVTRDGDQLFVQLTGQPALPVYAVAQNAFIYHVVEARIDFARDASGNVVSLTLHQNGATVVAPRTHGS